jgi:hypothetical protein
MQDWVNLEFWPSCAIELGLDAPVKMLMEDRLTVGLHEHLKDRSGDLPTSDGH